MQFYKINNACVKCSRGLQGHNNRKWGKPHSGASLDLFKEKHELSGARFLFCDNASDDVKHGRGGLWIGGEGRGWKLCDKPFSHPLYFRGQRPSPLPEDAVWSERACTFSAAALSLQKFSPWTVCLQAAQHWLYCKNQRLEAEVWNTQLKRELRLSLWGDAFSAQGCHLVVLRLKKKM